MGRLVLSVSVVVSRPGASSGVLCHVLSPPWPSVSLFFFLNEGDRLAGRHLISGPFGLNISGDFVKT